MSKGPGRVERAIQKALADEPDNAFTIEDLCDRAFAGINRIEKKHRVSVIRALRAIVSRDDRFHFYKAERQGRTMVLFDQTNVMSYAMARLKAGMGEEYRPTARRAATWWRARAMHTIPPAAQEAELRAKLLPGGEHHDLIVEGGHWWRHVELERSRRSEDSAALAKLQAEEESATAKVRAALGAQAVRL